MRIFGWYKIPLLAFCSPQITAMRPSTQIKIPLGWSTKNHLNSMYFGALAMGAELSVAATAVEEIFIKKKKASFVFKNFSCEFKSRAIGDVVFNFQDPDSVTRLIDESIRTQSRVEGSFSGFAFVPSDENKRVMEYSITLSIKPTA